jgi:gamma-glutamylcyclotransferase (GGCT)/AIG2-like uncharacterized protein YtfP
MSKRSKKRKNRYLKDASGKFQGSQPHPASPQDGVPTAGASSEFLAAPREVVTSDLNVVYALFSSEPAPVDNTPNVDEAVRRVAESLRLEPDSVRAALDDWTNADNWDFEDYAPPRKEFRYDLAPEAANSPRLQRALRKLGYEHFLRQQHPCFVYGTLRRGQGNSVLLDRARTKTVMAELPGVSIYTQHWGFPYAIEDPDTDTPVVGEIVWLDDSSEGVEARKSLDYLEGFNSDFPSQSHYERVETVISYWDEDADSWETTRAWVYLARGRAADSLRPEDRLTSGDWVLEKVLNKVN